MQKSRSQCGENMTSDQRGEWVRYRPESAYLAACNGKGIGILGLRSFKVLLWAAIMTVLSVIACFLVFQNRVSWSDIGTVAMLVFVLFLVSRKPAWITPLSWVVFIGLYLDVLDGFAVWSQPITAHHILLPLLVLYGALLCDILLTVVAMAGVLGICFVTWFKFEPLSVSDKIMLFYIVVGVLISGLASLVVWMHNNRLMREVRRQTDMLRLELDTNNLLNAAIFHDIANPLTVLTGTLELAEFQMPDKSTMSLLARMARRIGDIVESVRDISMNRVGTAERELVTADRIFADLHETFLDRMAGKQQTFSLSAGGDLAVKTVTSILTNSVLANLVSNAVKFSPAGSNIEMRASREDNRLRIEILDQGSGFSAGVLRPGGHHLSVSSAGTDGEKGAGLGLNIAAIYIEKIGGMLEIMNRPGGGGSSSVLLPVEDGNT